MGKVFENHSLLIFFPALFLAGFSLVLILSTASDLFSSQLLFFLLGFLIFILLSLFGSDVFLKSLATPFYIFSLLFLGSTFLSSEIRGTHRWIEAFGFRTQPSELTKPLLIASFAKAMSLFPPQKAKSFFLSFFLMIIPFFLVFKQPDLGNAVLYLGTWLAMVFAYGYKPIFLFSFFFFLSLASPLFWNFLKEYQKLRILSFLKPETYSQTANYHSIQAKISVGSGRFFGRGLGWGTQSHLKFLPEYYNDFIFASLCEELGFLGGALILCCYFFLLLQILKVGLKTKDSFSYLFSIGVFTQLLLQIFINIGMNLGLVPITGITLPLVSYGGSSILSTLMALGMVSSLKKEKKPKMLVIS